MIFLMLLRFSYLSFPCSLLLIPKQLDLDRMGSTGDLKKDLLAIKEHLVTLEQLAQSVVDAVVASVEDLPM